MIVMIQKFKKGFTLVELIVVLTILAILAALLIPALTGYITLQTKTALNPKRLSTMKSCSLQKFRSSRRRANSVPMLQKTEKRLFLFTGTEKENLAFILEIPPNMPPITNLISPVLMVILPPFAAK